MKSGDRFLVTKELSKVALNYPIGTHAVLLDEINEGHNFARFIFSELNIYYIPLDCMTPLSAYL